MDFDLIIAGADCAGSTVAKIVGEAGHSVLLIDEKNEKDLGRPWHDAVFPYVFELCGIKPFGKERKEAKTKIFSPNQKISGLVTGGRDYLISRRELSEKLIEPIKKMDNIIFKPKTEVIRPILNGNCVIGVEVKENNAVKQYISKITVDATGFNAVLRKQMPPETGIDSNSIGDYELAVATKQIRNRIDGEFLNESYIGVFGGSMWINNERAGTSEIGVRFRKDLNLNPEEIIKNLCKSRQYIGEEVFGQGTEIVPMRRCFDQLISDGFMLVGVAGFQSDPGSGMGVSSSILAGNLAAKNIIKAFQENKYDLKTLWSYQVDYFKEKGIEYAGLDVIRKYLQFLTEDEYDFLFEKEIVTFEIIEYLGGKKDSTADISFRTLLAKFLKGIVYRPGLMNRIRKSISQSDRMRKIYSKFPEEYDKILFDKWKFKVNKYIEKVKNQSYKIENKEPEN